MPAGRKPMGFEQVELLSGSEAAKRRLAVLLANVAGELSVDEACAALGLHKSRFFELRKSWLAESVQALEPEPSGRPSGMDRETSGMSLNPLLDSEIGSTAEKRPPRIAYNASGGVGPTPDTSGNRPAEAPAPADRRAARAGRTVAMGAACGPVAGRTGRAGPVETEVDTTGAKKNGTARSPRAGGGAMSGTSRP